jgi:branched-chain amino acid transport system substrate-binding protein
MKRRLMLLGIALIAMATVIVEYWTAGDHSASGPASLKFGVLLPLSGDSASYGVKARRAVQLAVDDLNTSNRCGRPIAAVFEDSAAQPITGLSAFQKLISADQVPIVIGDVVSSVTLAIAPTANRNKTVVLSPTASAPALTNAGAYIYRLWPSDLVEGHAIADYAIKRNFKRAAVLHINNDYGLAISNVFRNAFEQRGSTVITSEAYFENNQDFRSVLSKVGMLTPDVLYVAGYYADSATIARQTRELGLNIPILGTTAIEDTKFIELAGNAADGIIYPLSTGFDVTSSNPQVVRFVEQFKHRFNESPGWVESQTYDAVWVTCEAAATIKGIPTGENLKSSLDKIDTFGGVTGEIRFDTNGDIRKPMRLRIVQNGKFTNLGQ